MIGRWGGWLVTPVQSESGRLVLWLPVALACGIAAYFSLPREPDLWPALALALGLFLLTVLQARRGRQAVAIVALGLSMLCFGFGVAALRTHLVAAPVLSREIGPVMVTGRILESEPRATGRRLLIAVETLDELLPEDWPSLVRVQVSRGAEELAPDVRLRILAILRPPPGPVAPGAYDFARDAFFQGIGGVGYAVGPPEALEGEEISGPSRFQSFWAGLRQTIEARIKAQLNGDDAGVAIALMTGEKGAISDEVAEAMRLSGLAHLLAISGLHLGLVAGLVFLVLRSFLATIPALALDRPIKKWAAIAALPAAAAYLLLVGAPVPTQRAFIMAGLVLVAVLIDRQPISMRLVATAAVLVLLLSPESLVTPSFQMSFAAVIALVAFYEGFGLRLLRFTSDLGWFGRVLSYIAAVLATSLIASLATAPFAIFHFNRIVWLGLAANMIAVPATALWIMPWALIAYLLMPFGWEGPALEAMSWGINLVLWSARTIASVEGAASLVPSMPVWGLVLTAASGLWLAIWQRPWRVLAVPSFILGMVSFLFVTPPDVMVEEEGRLLALNDGGELLLSSGRIARFEAEIWLRRFGLEQSQAWGSGMEGERWQIACDDLACLARQGDTLISVLRAPAAWGEDCTNADLVINQTRFDLACAANPPVLDLYDLRSGGATAIWLNPLTIITARDLRGDRPWVIDSQ